MNKPSQEDLLGYMLGALEPHETVRVQKMVDASPELERDLLELKTTLAPLELLDEPAGSPPGLARRVCQSIASSRRMMPSGIVVSEPVFAGSVLAGPARLSAECDDVGGPGRGSWSLSDLMVACTAAAIVGAILLPAISLSRFNSRVTACQGNLQCLFHSMISYAEMNDGEFIKIPDSGALSVAGCFGPILKNAGLLENDNLLACAGVAGNIFAAGNTPETTLTSATLTSASLTASPAVEIPTLDQIQAAAGSIPQTLALQKKMGGHYGYALGHADNGIYRAPRSMGRANYALLSDSPTTNNGYTRSSSNHGPSGQNVLFEGGRVAFVTSPIIGTDEVFLNDLGMVAPGIHNADSVVAPSYVHPIKLVWQ